MTNQCDGCAQGLIMDGNNRTHYKAGRPWMRCTKERYLGTEVAPKLPPVREYPPGLAI